MCDTDVRSGCYADPLTLLKNCDATALGKICEAVSGMAEDSTAYANFPKRSLVKCFSARDKYQWHVTQTAELEELQKRWSTYKEEMRRKKQERRQPPPARRIIHEDRSGVGVVGYAHEGTNARRRAQHKTIKAPRVSPSPQAVNDDILREALMVAEHVEESDDVPGSLSSDQKCSSEGSQSARMKPSRNVHPTPSMERSRSTRGSATKPVPTPSMTTTPRQRQSSVDVRDKRQRPEISPRRKTPRHPDDSKMERALSPVTPPKRSASTATPRRGKLMLSSTKSNRPSISSSCKPTKAADSPFSRNGRTTGVRFRGAFGGCLGSKHASVDFSSSRSPADLPAHRHASSGPATRKFFCHNRQKKSPSCRVDRNGGSFGSIKFRASGGELRASLSRAWK